MMFTRRRSYGIRWYQWCVGPISRCFLIAKRDGDGSEVGGSQTGWAGGNNGLVRPEDHGERVGSFCRRNGVRMAKKVTTRKNVGGVVTWLT